MQKAARATARLVALIRAELDGATARSRLSDGQARFRHLSNLASLELRCIASMAARDQRRHIGRFVKDIPLTVLPSSGPNRNDAILRTAVRAVELTNPPTTLILNSRIQALTNAEPAHLAAVLGPLTTAVGSAISRLESQIARLDDTYQSITIVRSSGTKGMRRSLRWAAEKKIDKFCAKVEDKAMSWAGAPDSSASRLRWRESVNRHVERVIDRLTQRLSAKYEEFITTDLQNRLRGRAIVKVVSW